MMTTRTSANMISGRALAWYVRRLSVMQPGEVLSRVGSQYELAVLSLRHRLGLTATHADQLRFPLLWILLCARAAVAGVVLRAAA